MWRRHRIRRAQEDRTTHPTITECISSYMGLFYFRIAHILIFARFDTSKQCYSKKEACRRSNRTSRRLSLVWHLPPTRRRGGSSFFFASNFFPSYQSASTSSELSFHVFISRRATIRLAIWLRRSTTSRWSWLCRSANPSVNYWQKRGEKRTV